jgi:DNA adenine methylase
MHLVIWRIRCMIKSIFRYPGAKSSNRARSAIRSAFPKQFSEFRECFVGGGSTFFSMPARLRRWINDLNRPLVAVYEALKNRPAEFIELCRSEPRCDRDLMKERFHELLNDDAADLAVRYFFLNRCSFNGRVRLDDPWRHRTCFSNPKGMKIVEGDRLALAAAQMRDVRITSLDFEAVFDAAGENVLVYADPPYVRDTELSESSKLYQRGFTLADHVRLKQCVDRCNHKVLLSYDDHPLIRDLYRSYTLVPAEWTYMGNGKRIVGRELLISNYPMGDIENVMAA